MPEAKLRDQVSKLVTAAIGYGRKSGTYDRVKDLEAQLMVQINTLHTEAVNCAAATGYDLDDRECYSEDCY